MDRHQPLDNLETWPLGSVVIFLWLVAARFKHGFKRDSGGDILQTVTSVKNVGEVLNARLTEFPVPGN